MDMGGFGHGHGYGHPIGVVTPLSLYSQRMENGDVARSPGMAEGPFSEIGE